MAVTQDNINLPYAERLRIYQIDKNAAKAELVRIKDVYRMEYPTATQARLAQISNWAQQVRAAAGIPEDDPIFGNSQYVSPDVQQSAIDFYKSSGSGSPSGVSAVTSNPDVMSGIVLIGLLFGVGAVLSKNGR